MQINTKLKFNRQVVGLLSLVIFVFLASGFSLNISFTSQAPEGDWSEPWYNDCEEVSIVMVDSFYNKKTLTPSVAKNEILRIIGIKEKEFGPSLEEDADEMVSLINNYLNSNWKAQIAENPTIEQMKKEIDNGHPIIMPVDGRKLNNRYYTTTHYHVFAISGYDDGKKMFIAQDPGTYRGHDYQYSYAVIENAMHDYDFVDQSKGRRVAIFTSSKEEDNLEKTNESKIEINPTPSAVIDNDIPASGEIKKDDLPAEPKNLLEKIKNYWTGFMKWLKRIFIL